MGIINQRKFNIVQLGNNYRMMKKCNISNRMYKVDLDYIQFKRYYTPKGKVTKHLTDLNKNQIMFLQTTCTPAEIKSLSEDIKSKIHKKLWRFYIKKD